MSRSAWPAARIAAVIRRAGGIAAASWLARRTGGAWRPARPGLTLVETLVGLMLLGLVSMLGFSALGLVGQAGRAAATDRTALLAVQDLLRLRLLTALPVMAEGAEGRPALLFEGMPNRLLFVTELPPRFGVAGPALVDLRQEGDLLALRWRPLRGTPAGGEGGGFFEGAAGRVLLQGIAGLRLRYFGAPRPREEAAWRDSWLEAPTLPVAIDLAVAFREEDARTWPPLVVAPRLAASPTGAAP